MCTKKGIINALEEMGDCDIQTIQRHVHMSGHLMTNMAVYLWQLIHDGEVAVSCGIYSLKKGK